MSKYHAQPVTIDGIRFDSKAEAHRYNELRLLERAGQIEALQVHPRYELAPAARDRFSGARFARIMYEADFCYVEKPSNRIVVEDVKGVETAVFSLKRRLFILGYPDLELRLVRA